MSTTEIPSLTLISDEDNELVTGNELYVAPQDLLQDLLQVQAAQVDLAQYETESTDYGFFFAGDSVYVQVFDKTDMNTAIDEFEITRASYDAQFDSDAAVVTLVGQSADPFVF